MKKTTLYIVGDSTLSAFNDAYYYPRYGYGTQLKNYLNSNITICNLAMSGRSSKSYLKENNYQLLKASITKDDFLIIGFGHNDQKSADMARFTAANKDINDKDSFKYSLYYNYVKLALDKGATPILCTPIVRANPENDFTGNCAHNTINGDYRKAILDLGKEKNIFVIDLTELTKKRYLEIGYENARYYHAMTLGIKENDVIIPNLDSVDTTHLNIYGAKYVAYLVCKVLKENNHLLGDYVDNLVEPVKDIDLIKNPNYKILEYKSPDLMKYKPQGQFMTKGDFYGTAFGDCSGSPKDTDNGFCAYEDGNCFIVGQKANIIRGKINTAGDGFAFCFKQVEAKYNFELACDAEVLEAGEKEAAFGLMLRDDCYINQMESKITITSNYITAGLYCKDDACDCLFYREANKLNIDNNRVDRYKNRDRVKLQIIRIGQSMKVVVEYKEKAYEKTFYDFDCFAVDKNYLYVGMFATRGTLIRFNNVSFKILGVSEGA